MIEEFTFLLVLLRAFDRKLVLLGRDLDLLWRKPSDSQRDLVAILGKTFDVEGRVVVLGGTLSRFCEVKQAVEADGRAPKGRKVVSAHSQLLQRARWLRAA